jgi:hypothetical protein
MRAPVKDNTYEDAGDARGKPFAQTLGALQKALPRAGGLLSDPLNAFLSVQVPQHA